MSRRWLYCCDWCDAEEKGRDVGGPGCEQSWSPDGWIKLRVDSIHDEELCTDCAGRALAALASVGRPE